MLTVMRLNARWASGARFRREIPLQAESPLTRGLKALHDHLQGFCDIRDVDTVRYLAPFVAVVRSARASGPLTGAALSSLHKFLLYGFLSRHATRAREAVDLVGAGIAGCVFEETDSESDEVTLMKLLELSALSLRCDAGILLSDLRIWEMFQAVGAPVLRPLRRSLSELNASARQVCYRVSCQERASGLLRSTADNTLAHIVLLLFSRVHDRLPRGTPGAPGAAARAAARRGEDDRVGRQRRRRGSSRPPPARAIPSPARRRRPVRHDAGPDADQATGGPNEVSVLVNVMRFPVRRAAHPHRALPLGAPTHRALVRRLGAPRRLGSAEPTTVSRSRSSTLRSGGGRRSARRHRSSTLQGELCKHLLHNSQTDEPTILCSRPRRVQPVLLDQGPPQSPARSLPHVGPPPNRRRRLGGQWRPVRARPGAPAGGAGQASPCSRPRCASSPRACSPRASCWALVGRRSNASSRSNRSSVLREPARMLDLYINYDCDVQCTNLFETICSPRAPGDAARRRRGRFEPAAAGRERRPAGALMQARSGERRRRRERR